MCKIKSVFLSAIILLILNSHSLLYPPVWVTNSYVQAGNNNVINSLTGNSVTPTHTFPFNISFSGVPNLGYGIKAYKGNDYFGEEQFQVNRTSLSASSFSVAVQIVGITNIYILNVPFIAIDPLFPHHLNSFDNVPVNYGAGSLTNITVRDTVNTRYYSNTINYTTQVGLSSVYDSFLTPFTRNKILTFLTSLFIKSTNQADPANGPFNPLTFQVTANVVSTTQYKIKVSICCNAEIAKVHFSIIVFDETDVQSTGLYMLVYEKFSFPNTGGFKPIPFQFIDNFIMGFTDFSTIRTKSAIHFEWDFQTQSGVQGVLMPVSVGLSPTGYVINQVGYTMFYMKTWICPNQTFFDPTQNMCTGCPVLNCLDCLNYRVCSNCSAGYTQNLITGLCDPPLSPSSPNQCSYCQKFTLYRLSCNEFVINAPKNVYTGTLSVSIQNPTLLITKVEQDQLLVKIYVQYSTDFLNQTVKLNLTSTDYFQLAYLPMIPSVYYSSQECSISQNIGRLLQAIQIISYLVLLFSLASLKIVGLQLFGVLQLAYFGLISHSYFDLYLSPLKQFKTFNGINVEIIPNSSSSSIPKSMSQLKLSNSFLNNFNIMLILCFGELMVGAGLFILGRLLVHQKLRRISSVLLRQGFITVVMFNIFNFSFSAGIQIKYGHNQPMAWVNNLVIAVFFLAIIFAVAFMELGLSSRKYGQFKNKFKMNWLCRLYITLSIIMRIFLGFFISLKQDYQESTLLVLAFIFIFLMYNVINLPFVNAYQNYRACFCHVTQLVILIVTNYYRSMKSNTPMNIKAHIHIPALIQIVMITLCMMFSIAILVYQIIKMIKAWKLKTLIKDDTKPLQINENTQNSMQQINFNFNSK